MTTPKFTPGPWRIHHAGKRRKVLACNVIDAEYRAVCSFFGPREQAVANAQLCAAAPELYAALELAVATAEGWATGLAMQAGLGASEWPAFVPPWFEKARAALGKAVAS